MGNTTSTSSNNNQTNYLNTNSNNNNSNKSSSNSGFDNFDNIIDFIATYYILTMDFKSLKKLYKKEYCDELVILTSGIIERYFTDVEISYIAQRIKNGEEVNEMAKENVMFLTKDQFDHLDVKNDKTKNIKKRALCLSISKYYVKIAHIFAAIVMTINPVYIYKDPYGNLIKSSLLEKDKIPLNVPRKLYKLNICDERIDALRRGQLNNPLEFNGEVVVSPKVCNMNINKNGTVKTLADEPGIPELKQLYYDDKYDFNSGEFKGMSSASEQKFKLDLKQFYTIFTGNEVMPENITKFGDIKLKDYQQSKNCQEPTPFFKNKYVGNMKDKLFADYANNLKMMIQKANTKQDKLLEIINVLFTYVIDPFTGKKKIRVNPKLTEDLLQKTIETTRKTIIDLYLTCEMDYNRGIKIFEAIIENKILETTQNQIKNLEREAAKLVQESKI